MISEQDIVEQFRRAMADEKIKVEDEIIADGSIHRCHVVGDSKGSKNGWFVLHIDEHPAGQFGCNKRYGEKQKFSWSLKGQTPLAPEQRKVFAIKMTEAKKRKAEEEAARHAVAAQRANEIWNAGVDVVKHPYLERKGVRAHKIRIGDWPVTNPETGAISIVSSSALLIPLRNVSKKIHSLQAIFPDKKNFLKRDKDFLSGARKQGLFFTIGKPVDKTFILGEGYATCATIHETTGHAVVICFDRGNLIHVARALRAKFPHHRIIFAADNDQWTTEPIDNPGLTSAREASIAIGGLLVMPPFTDADRTDAERAECKGPTDFNDLAQLHGYEAVREQIDAALKMAPTAGCILGPAMNEIVGMAHAGECLPFCDPIDCRQNARLPKESSIPIDVVLISDDPVQPVEFGINPHDVSNSLEDAKAIVLGAIALAKSGDAGAIFESPVVDALRTIEKTSPAEFQRQRTAIKKSNTNVHIGALDKVLSGGAKSDDKTSSDLVVDLVRLQCTLFHCQDKEPHATFVRNGHRECWHVFSIGFREWACYEYYKACGGAPSDAAIAAALNTLTGQAKFEGEKKQVAVRVAKDGEDYYVDLCDESWRAVRITSTGWQVIDAPPIMFVRSNAMRPLPNPEPSGDIGELWNVANIELDDRDLVLAWMIEAFRPDTPYPVLELFAEQGAAKSFTQSTLRNLIDPNKANLRAKPKSIDDLFVTAKASHMVSLENLSHLEPTFQDAMCALATGAGYGGRTLYTNAEETVFEVKRPIMLNGIAVVATAQDLMDRTLLISLPRIEGRRTESDLNNQFNQLQSGIFGALMTLFSGALAVLPTVKIEPAELPRMADFACLGEAVLRVLGRPEGDFLARYHEKRKHGVFQTIESSPVASAALAWLEHNPHGFDGPIKRLHDLLSDTEYKPDGEHWPKSAKGFADALRRVSPALRMLGFSVECTGRKSDGYHWRIKQIATFSAGNFPKQVHEVHEVHNAGNSALSNVRHEHAAHDIERSYREKELARDIEVRF
jgi:phage/plasmid primase-like uncharacterized protein